MPNVSTKKIVIAKDSGSFELGLKGIMPLFIYKLYSFDSIHTIREMEDPSQTPDEIVVDVDALSRSSGTLSSSEDHCDVPAEELHVSMMKRIEKVPGEPLGFRPVTIFRLPSWFHEKSKELCEPKIVSIGPFHHGKASLRSMEEHKWSTLRDFLARNKNVSIQYYLEAMRSLEAEARQCYSETVNMHSDEFVMMLLLDGCFILEWFTKHHLNEVDVVCSGGWAMAIFSDMCLLENQLPFFVIHKLKTICDFVKGSQNHEAPDQNCKGISCPLMTSGRDEVKECQKSKGVNDHLFNVSRRIEPKMHHPNHLMVPRPRMHHPNHLSDAHLSDEETTRTGSEKNCRLLELIFKYLSQFKLNKRSLHKSDPKTKREDPITDLVPQPGGENTKGGSGENCPLLELTFKYLPRQFKFKKSALQKISSGNREIKHLLHFYYQVLLSDIEPRANIKEGTSNTDAKRLMEPTNIRCATELHNAGITFKKREGDCNLLDITFHKGTILMPSLSIQSDILTILWNMVAFEQSYPRSVYPPILSSYLVLMDSLIDTQKDVAILERSSIIKNFFPTTEEAAAFFNQFADNFSIDFNNHHFYELFKQINEYSESTWPRHRARLMQDYFSNPWSIISVVVAAILLILTFLQTYFSAPK